MSKNIGIKIATNSQEATNGIKSIKKELMGLRKEFKETSNGIDKAFNIGKPIAFAKAISDIFNIMVNASKKQADYAESLNLLQQAYDGASESGENLIKVLSTKIGFDEASLTKQLGNYRQLSNAFDIDSKYANLLSENLLKLQQDVSSLYNLEDDVVANKFTSAMVGQSRAVRSLGVDITDANLQIVAQNLGIEESVHNMSQANKMILRYITMEQQLANANGDASRTINSVANQTRIFKEQIAIAGRQIGAIFIPILKAILPVINGILMALNEIGSMILGFFGIKAKSLASEFGDGLSDIYENFDNIGSSADSATGSINKTKQALRGFDKLNNITTPDKTSGGGGGAVSGLGGINQKLLDALKEYNLHLDEMRNKATAIRDRILEWLGFSKDVNGQWKWSAKTLLKNIWEWWRKLNTVAKVFVTLGLAVLFSKIATSLAKVFTTVKNFLALKFTNALEYFRALKELGGGTLTGTIDAFFKLQTATQKLVTAVTGITIAGGGLFMIISAFQDMRENGINAANVIEMIIGVLGLMGGAIITVSSIVGGFSSTLALATGGLSLLFGAIAILITNLVSSASATNDATTATKYYSDALKDALKSANDAAKGDLEQIARSRELTKELGNLVDSNGKVREANKSRVEQILGILSDALGQEYKLTGDQITINGKIVSSYKDIVTAIDNVIEAKKREVILKHYEEVYLQALKDRAEATKELDELNQRVADNNGEITKEDLKRRDEIIAKYDANNQIVEDYEKLVANVGDKTKNLNDFMRDVGLIGSKAWQDVKKDAEQFYDYIDTGTATIRVDANTSEAERKIKQLASKRITLDYSQLERTGTAGLQFKADGGFLNTGEMFIAREAGPEMVGRIGNRTAVANNDQIVDGVSIGVANGVSRALAGYNGGNTNVTIEAKGDASGLLNYITFEQRKQNRQYGLD